MNKILIILILITCISYSCSKEPNGLSVADRMLVDSLFNTEKELMETELDSICKAEKVRIFKKAVDSISRQRIAEINQILK